MTPTKFLASYITTHPQVTAREVLELASNPENPMHSWFTWDDHEAAKKHRLWQARQLISTVRIEVVKGSPISIRAMVSAPNMRHNGGGYVHIDMLAKDAQLRASIESDIRQRVAYWKKQEHLLSDMTRAWIEAFPDTDAQECEEEKTLDLSEMLPAVDCGITAICVNG